MSFSLLQGHPALSDSSEVVVNVDVFCPFPRRCRYVGGEGGWDTRRKTMQLDEAKAARDQVVILTKQKYGDGPPCEDWRGIPN